MDTLRKKHAVYFNLLAPLFLILFLSLFIKPDFIMAESTTMGSLYGKITDQKGMPLSNIEVLVAEQPIGMRGFVSLPYLLPPWAPDKEVDTMVSDYYPYRYSSIDFTLPPLYRTKSQSNGTFLLSDVPPGKYSLWAYDPENRGFIPAVFGIDDWTGPGLKDRGNRVQEIPNQASSNKNIPVRVNAGENCGPFDLVMKMGGTLSGRITNADNGASIAGAKIGVTPIVERHTYQSLPSSVEYHVITSDSEGNFILSGLPQGKYRLEVKDAEGYIVEEGSHHGWYGEPLIEEAEASSEDIYTVLPGTILFDCNITLHRGAEIFGTITSKADGTPIADIEVQVMCIRSESDSAYAIYYGEIKTRSTSDGTYRVSGLEAGDYVLIIKDTAEFQGMYYPNTRDSNRAREISVKARESIGSINFQLPPVTTAGSIKGQIVAEGTGIPLSGITVDINRIYVQGQDYYRGFELAVDNYSSNLTLRMMLPPLTFYMPSSVTDSEGKFEFTGLAEGKYSLNISDPTREYLPSSYPTISNTLPALRYLNYYIELSENQEINDITIPLLKGGCLKGHVTDGIKPLAGISVMYTKIATSHFPYPNATASFMYDTIFMSSEGMTDTEGDFSLCGLEEGDYVVWAEDTVGRGYKLTFYSNHAQNNGKPHLLTLSSGGIISGLNIAMESGATLRGTVVDTEGKTLANIPVEIYLKDGFDYFSDQIEGGIIYGIFPSSSLSTYTDENGDYTLTGLFDGEYELMVNIFGSKYLSNCNPDITISSSENNVADIVLSIGGIISGKVTNIDGQPLSGITVSIYNSMSMSQGYDEPYLAESSFCAHIYNPYTPANPVNTADDGTYQIKGLREGNYTISAYDPEGVYLNYDDSSASIAVFEGSETSHIDFSLTKGGTITGTIRDQVTKQPLSGVIVLAEEKTDTQSDAYSSSGYYPSLYQTYEASPYGMPSAPMRRTYYSLPSDNQGRYTICGLPEGSYSISVSSENSYQSQYFSAVSTPEEASMVAVRSAQTVNNIDFNLIQGMSLEGIVRNAFTGEVIAKGCNVRLMDEEMKEIKNTYSNFSGNYKFIGLSPGTYYVEVMDYQGEYYPAGYRAEGSVAEALDPVIILPSLSVDEINVALFPKASLSGRITDEHDLQTLDSLVVIAIPIGYDLRAIASPGEPAPYPGPYYQAETSYAMSAEPYVTTYGPVIGTGGGTPYGPYGDYYQLQFALTDGDGQYTIKNLEEGDYRILVLDPAYIYEGEYYKNFSPDQWEQATIIHIKRSEAHQGYNMKLHVGELYSEKDEYPYILLRDYYPTVGYISSSSGPWSWEGSGSSGGSSGAMYGSTGFPAQPGGPIGESASLEIISEAADQAAVDRIYTYQVQVADLDPEISIKYALQKNPAGMTIDPESGLIQWQPKNEDKGSNIVQVQVSAGSDIVLLQSAFQSFRLNVMEDLTPPDEIEGLAATAGDTQIMLSWAPSKDSAGDLAEQVLYIDNGTGYDEGRGLGKTATTYTVTNLENDTQYTFKITARDDLGNESTGAIVAATPQAIVRTQSTSLFQNFYPSSFGSNIDTSRRSNLLGSYWDNLSFRTFSFPLWNPQITSNWWESPAPSLFHGNNSLQQQEGINSYWQ